MDVNTLQTVLNKKKEKKVSFYTFIFGYCVHLFTHFYELQKYFFFKGLCVPYETFLVCFFISFDGFASIYFL